MIIPVCDDSPGLNAAKQANQLMQMKRLPTDAAAQANFSLFAVHTIFALFSITPFSASVLTGGSAGLEESGSPSRRNSRVTLSALALHLGKHNVLHFF